MKENAIFDDLIKRVKSGDERAFEIIVGNYSDKIIGFLYKLKGNQEGLEDIAQETWKKFYKSIFKYEKVQVGLLFSIARNEFFTFVGKEKKHLTESDESVFTQSLIEKSDNPEQLLERKDIQNQLEEQILKLSQNHQNAVILIDILGCSYAETAEILCVPLQTIKSWVRRGRRKLKEFLSKQPIK